MSTAYGAIGLDNLCGACISNGCLSGCGENGYVCAWPYFNECSTGTNCRKQTSRPFGGGCGYYIVFDSPCEQAGVAACITECGPDPYYYNTPCCQPATRLALACVNTAAFLELCRYSNCNPANYNFCGVTYGSGSTTGIRACS